MATAPGWLISCDVIPPAPFLAGMFALPHRRWLEFKLARIGRDSLGLRN
jgi:hypothetical protein